MHYSNQLLSQHYNSKTECVAQLVLPHHHSTTVMYIHSVPRVPESAEGCHGESRETCRAEVRRHRAANPGHLLAERRRGQLPSGAGAAHAGLPQ